MKLKDHTEAIARISQLLATHYGGRLEDGYLAELRLHLGELDSGHVEKALTRHLLNPEPAHDGRPLGSYPPSLADLMRHIRDLEAEQRRQALEERNPPDSWDLDSGEIIQVSVPVEVRQQYDLPDEPLRLRPAHCAHCSDRGLARFWYDPKDHQRVWLHPEWMQLPRPMQMGLSCASAVCDCPCGLERPERQWTTTLRWKGEERSAPVFPRLEHLRKLTARRRRWEEEEIGVST